MKATGITRRIDDLGRIVIPKTIRESVKIKEGDPLEIFIENNNIVLKKYFADKKTLAESCAEWVNKNKNIINSVISMGDKTMCSFKKESGSYSVEVYHNKLDTFDLNIAICYCAIKCGFYVEGI